MDQSDKIVPVAAGPELSGVELRAVEGGSAVDVLPRSICDAARERGHFQERVVKALRW